MFLPLSCAPALKDALPPGTSVLLALSGGVDSGMTLAVLKHLECEVEAVTFRNFCYGDIDETPSGEVDRNCCSLDAIESARRLAAKFGARHHVIDVADRFSSEVIEPFVAAYEAGRTPNPCQDCNARVRFPALVSLARQLGLERIATGHYARVAEVDGRPRLLRGLDRDKDQAYFLYGVEADLLGNLVFPLGWSTKAEVREGARLLGLDIADRPESQEICFVPDDDRSFLFEGEAEGGEIVDVGGHVLGRHRGLIHYTVGQRRGLGVAAAHPLYVLSLDVAENRLIVGPREALAAIRIYADRIVTADAALEGDLERVKGVTARIRHRHAGVSVVGWRRRGAEIIVDLAAPVYGAAPGQGLVLYANEVVLGGGRILAADADPNVEVE